MCKTSRIFSLCLWLVFGFIAVAWGVEPAHKHVLVINSYHYGMDWTDGQISAVQQVLEGNNPSLELHVEYMDTKRASDENHLENFRQLLDHKYRNTRIDAIISTDNDAFNFLRRYRDQLFIDVPVVFSGVNFFQEDMLAGLKGFAGVAETFEGGQTIGEMLRLHPQAKRIVVIFDTTITSQAIRDELAPMLVPYAGKVSFDIWDDLSLEQLSSQLSKLGQDTLVLLMPFARDREGVFVTYPQISNLVSHASSVPVYGTWDFYMGYGIVGGRLTNAAAQGQAAAKIVLRILAGESAEQIPVTRIAPSEFQFDARQLLRFGISVSRLPVGSKVLFQSPEAIYRNWIIAGVFLVIITLLAGWGWGRNHILRRKSVMALQKSEERYRVILKQSPTGILHYDRNLVITYCNDRFAQIINTPVGRLIGLDMNSLQDQRILPALRMAAVGNLGVYVGEYVPTLSAVSCWISMSCSPFGDSENESAIAFVEDITERKRNEGALQESEALQRTLLASLSAGVILVDPVTRIIESANPHVEMLFGGTVDHLLGQRCHALLCPAAEGACPVCDLGQAVDNSDRIMLRRDGSPLPILKTVNRIHLNGQEKLLECFVDISDRRRAEDELRESNIRLEEAIDLTKDMAAKANAANTAKSMFLSNMSHEIRTPMNGVIGMTTLLLETELTTEQREFAEIVSMSAENLLALLNDILDFSKIEAGKLDIESIDFDLQSTLEDTTYLLALRAEAAGLEMICQIDPGVPMHLKGDPGRLRQILTNLAGNAIKFTSQGEVVIHVRQVSETDGKVVLRFEVQDTGIGIPVDRQAVLFTSFTQVDSSTTRKYGGTGLGLAISKQLSALMGGEIGLESVEGQGSTFWFTARFEKQDEAGIEHPVPLFHMADNTARILVVDDNATNLKLMDALLKNWGYPHELVNNGEGALKLMHEALEQNAPFRIVVLDHQMPDMDGCELGCLIKADPLLKTTLMVMLTSIGQRGDAAILEQIGFVGYLTKPVRQVLLYDCLAMVLAKDNGESARVGKKELVTRHTIAESKKLVFRILLAEDNLVNQKFVQIMLSKVGYQVDVVSNGLEALRALEMIDYDLVLMDCQMPVMDGYEATAMIRDASSKVLNHEVPIIAMTANAMTGDREKCLAVGMTDYIAKPVDSRELRSKVEEIHGQQPVDEVDITVGATSVTVWDTEPAPAQEKGEVPDDPSVLDTVSALQMVDGDESIFLMMLSGVRKQMMSDRLEISSAITLNDHGMIKRVSHRLKGGVGQIGAVRAQHVCAQLEVAAAIGDSGVYGDLQQKLTDELDALEPAIDAYLAKYSIESA